MAGYSKTPLWKKLGIKPDHQVALYGAPDDFETTLGPLPAGAQTTREPPHGGRNKDVVVFFSTSADEIAESVPALIETITTPGGLWLAWPKKASKVPTDIKEQTLRDLCLPTGLVDNKVCAIDATWSGLRFVIRKELRAARDARSGD